MLDVGEMAGSLQQQIMLADPQQNSDCTLN